jgi:DUF2075 family protein
LAKDEILVRVKQAYRILLTRAIKGVFVWCEDPNTATHLRDSAGLTERSLELYGNPV